MEARKLLVPSLITVGWLAACAPITGQQAAETVVAPSFRDGGFREMDAYSRQFGKGSSEVTLHLNVGSAVCPLNLSYGLGGDNPSVTVPLRGDAPVGTKTALFTDKNGEQILVVAGNVVQSTLPPGISQRLADDYLRPSQRASNEQCDTGTLPAALELMRHVVPTPQKIPNSPPMRQNTPQLQAVALTRN